ncbi:SPOR domain-containing protein [Leeia oryzae]|uniref:SPOR domain-containing protein n=1 Tax=Leeia oryzae TaxID=356662 RepID=UPI00037B4E4E|nr:SPOR domain-containing protein [Leeia oryzae]
MNDKVSKIQSLNEEQQLLKRRARRRLVGAIALVLLMVIVLPMVLDTQPKANNQDVKIEIPDQNANSLPALATPANEAPASSDDVSTVAAVSAPTQSVTAEIPKETQDSTASVPADKAATKGLKEAADKQAQLDAEKQRQLKLAQDKQKQQDDAKKAAELKKQQEALNALADKQQTPPAKADAAKSEQQKKPYVVQFAALNDGSKAKDLLQKLSGHGIRAFVVTVHTDKGEFSKVRAGPYASKDEADYVRKKAEAAGLPAIIVTN